MCPRLNHSSHTEYLSRSDSRAEGVHNGSRANRVLIRSSKFDLAAPSGGQFYSAYNCVAALFRIANHYRIPNFRLGMQVGVNDDIVNQYLATDYKREGDIVIPIAQEDRYLRQFKHWDIVHYITEDIVPKELFTRRKKILHVRGILDWLLMPKLPKRKYRKHLKLKFLWPFFDRILVPSKITKIALNTHYRIPETRIDVLPNGFDTRLFYRTSRTAAIRAVRAKFGITRPFVLHVSNLSQQKNVEAVLRGFKVFQERSPEFDLVIVGGREDVDLGRYHNRTTELGIRHRVVFLGILEQAELVELYNSAEVFWYPTLNDSFGKPTLEAMACGCPVIVSESQGPAELVGRRGVKISANDYRGMAEKTTELIRCSERKREYSQYCKHRADEYSWDAVAYKLLNIYSTL